MTKSSGNVTCKPTLTRLSPWKNTMSLGIKIFVWKVVSWTTSKKYLQVPTKFVFPCKKSFLNCHDWA